MSRRRYVTKAEIERRKALIVAKDDYTEECERCGAGVGQPCTLQGEAFRQYPNTKTVGCEFVPAGQIALRIHWERRYAVLERRKRAAL